GAEADDAEVEREPEQQPAPSGSGPTPSSSIPAGSLFDIEEPEDAAEKPAAEAGKDPAGDRNTDLEREREQPKAADEQPPIRSIKEIKAEFAGDGDAAGKTPATAETDKPDATEAAADSDADAADDAQDTDDEADEPVKPSGSGE